jgi:hypothetical protein
MTKVIIDSALRAAVNLRSSKLPTELVKANAALFSAYGGAKQTLPDLTYDYGALARTYPRTTSLTSSQSPLL